MSCARPSEVLDAHHHLWDLSRFPYRWLAPEAPPRAFGDHAAIKRDHLPADYRAAVGDVPVVQTVHVQAECGAADPVAETAWLADLARDAALPNGVVFHADLAAETAPRILADNARFGIARGVRAPVSWQPSGKFSFANRPGVMSEPGFLDSAAILPGLDLTLDLVILPEQMPEVAALARRLPDLNIIINHLGTAELASETQWRKGIDAIAPHGNIALKLSGLWTIDKAWRAEILAPFLQTALAAMGAARLLWGSNAPVETLNCAIPRQIDMICEVFDDLPQNQIDLMFAGTARRLYRL